MAHLDYTGRTKTGDAPRRVVSIDSARGLVIVLMILEHSRQFLSGRIIREVPGINAFFDMSVSDAVIRSLSHVCAPGFFFLLGVSSVLAKPAKPLRDIRRGLMLMGVQLTLVNLGWALPLLVRTNFAVVGDSPVYLGVLFSLGCSFVILRFLRRVPAAGIAVITALIAAAAFFPDYSENNVTGLLVSCLWGEHVEVPYPLLPWMTVSLAGVMYARLFLTGSCCPMGTALHWPFVCILFFLGTGLLAVLKIPPENFHKYPPSLTFIAVNVLAMLFVITLFSRFPLLSRPWLQAIGRNPLLVYILHLYLLGVAAAIAPGASLIDTAAVAAVVAVSCLFAARLYESDLFIGSRLNVFNTHHRIYDRFMDTFALYHPEEVGRSLPRTSNGRLLDIAGGTGYMAEQLSRRFEHVVVVDLSEAMLTVARERGVDACLAEAQSLPFSANTFTAVICTDALHHIKNSDQTVREMQRVLQAGGKVVIQELHIKGVPGLFCFLMERLFVDDSVFIAPAELETLMAGYGFEGRTRTISRVEYVYEGFLVSKDK